MIFEKEEISKVGLIGLGALGILFGSQINQEIKGDLTIIAGDERIRRYQEAGVYANGQACYFNYKEPSQGNHTADLIIFAVKMAGLEEAILDVENFVGPKTLFLSLLNGVVSEKMIAEVYGQDNVIYAVAQGMDAVKTKNQLSYTHPGLIAFGDRQAKKPSNKVKRLQAFFDKTKIANEINNHMDQKIWSKLLLNVGVNQVVAVYGENYGDVQRKGQARDLMIKAMAEVIPIANKEGIALSQADIDYWLKVIDGLDPDGKPSMRQDIETGRQTELALFSGTILKLGASHGIEVPINQILYDQIRKKDLQVIS